ncbi:MAG: VWA domain-containing protein [Egibacteraceae bacterium]
MDRLVNEFVAVLRDHGLRVSPAETMDALRALTAVDLARREEVQDTLRTTLCKSSADIPAFDHLFDLFFSAPLPTNGSAHAHHHHHHHPHREREEEPPGHLEVDIETPAERGRSDDHGEATPELRRFFDQRRLRQTPGGGHDDSDRLRLSLFAQQLILNRKNDALDRVLRRVTQNLRVRRARNMLMPGSLTRLEGGDELPLDVSATELSELVDQLHELDVDPELIAELEAQADAIRAQLPQLIQQLLDRQRLLSEGLKPEVWQRNLVRVQTFSEPERRQLEAAIRQLAKRLRGSTSRRRTRGHRGEISIPHTLRRNMRYDGMPFEPAFRAKRQQKPNLVVLCDVSLSTRNLARFWLQLIYQLQDLFSKVRTFVFVADIVEVTDIFREKRFERAVEEVFSGQLLDVDVNSDFGKAIGRFGDEYLTVVGRRTTVVVLGDARNNGRPPNEQALEEVARLARRVIWMTPEPRWGWSLGGCDMRRYEPLCQRVEVVRTVEQLSDVAEELLHDRVSIPR